MSNRTYFTMGWTVDWPGMRFSDDPQPDGVSDRDWEMYHARLGGLTYMQIGDRNHLSASRARQIILRVKSAIEQAQEAAA
jgi:hypothetical protein